MQKKESCSVFKFKQFLRNKIFIAIPFLCIVIFATIYLLYFTISKKWFSFDESKLGLFIGALSGLSGFFVACTGFIIALNKSNPITKKFFKTVHPRLMLYACLLGVLSLIIALVLFLVTSFYTVVMGIAIFSIGEMIVVLYYLLHLFKQYIVADVDSGT